MLRIITVLGKIQNLQLDTTDLNTLVTQGSYEGFNCTPTNDPAANTVNDWSLDVAVSGDTIEQILESAQGKWTRSSSNGGSTWAAWVNDEQVAEDARYARVGKLKTAVVAGGAAGDIAVTDIKTGDTLDAVIYYVGAGTAVTDVVDLTSEFTIKAGNGVITNTGGTATTGGKLEVRWTKLTA